MNAKIKFVVPENTILSYWMLNLLAQQFNVESYNATNTYTKHDLYYIVDIPDSAELQRILNTWPGKIVMNDFYEACPLDDQCYTDNNNIFHLTARDFIWWQFSYELYQMQYQHTFSKIGGDKFFLLLMNWRRPHRDWLYNLTCKKYHDHALYSYFHQNKSIDGDMDREHVQWQLYCNMDWYDRTCFSLVAETKIQGKTFVSEKLYKPMAVGHPFLACGTKGMLNFLKLQGFETFSGIIDESYDSIHDDSQRLRCLEKELDRLFELFKKDSLFQEPMLNAILEHNHRHFFNLSHVDNLMITQILEPLLEYYHTT